MPIDKSFLKPFIVGAIRTVKDLSGVDVQFETMGPSASFTERYRVDIAGVIGITGNRFKGAMTLCFPKEVFLLIMNKMLGENHTELNHELEDGAAELSNIIFGQAKAALNQAGHQIKMAIPSVIRGERLESGCPTSTSGDLVILKTPAGPFIIEFAGALMDEDRAEALALAQTKRGKEIPKLDAQVLLHFVNGIQKTLRVQCNVEPIPGKPYPRKGLEGGFTFQIGGIIGITSASFGGTFSICFEKDVFLQLVYNLTGEQFTEITKDIEDAAAEIVNICFGTAKKLLNADGYVVQSAIPTIVRGINLHSAHPANKPPIVMPFSVFNGFFWVEFAFEHLLE